MKRSALFSATSILILTLALAVTPAGAQLNGTVQMPQQMDPNIIVSGEGVFSTPADAETIPGVPFPGVTGAAGVDHDGIADMLTTVPGVGGFRSSSSLLWTGRHILTAAHSVTDEFGNVNLSTGTLTYELSGGNFVYGFTAADVTVHPDWNGSINNGADLAIITLANPVDNNIPRYNIYTNDVVQELIDDYANNRYTRFGAGYGVVGVGDTGMVPGTSGTKHFGYNVYDGYFVDGLNNPQHEFILYDFDTGEVANSLIGGLGLGDLESNTAPGDSGGPGFIYDPDADEYFIAGVTSFSSRVDGFDVDSELNRSFGEYSGDTNVGFYSAWINSIVVPEPASGTLLLVGGGLFLLARRRR